MTTRSRRRAAAFTLCALMAAAPAARAQAPVPNPTAQRTAGSTEDTPGQVGTDAQGHVSFILDNNRGKDGAKYQAEHLVLLHDEQQGWVELAGNGSYPNLHHDTARIPDSPNFRFEGTPESGITISSSSNNLVLKIGSLTRHTQNQHNGGETWMSAGPAELTWRGRTIPGRVIYEYVMMPNFNRLTKTYWGMWKGFQGLYLSAALNIRHTHLLEETGALRAFAEAVPLPVWALRRRPFLRRSVATRPLEAVRWTQQFSPPASRPVAPPVLEVEWQWV